MEIALAFLKFLLGETDRPLIIDHVHEGLHRLERQIIFCLLDIVDSHASVRLGHEPLVDQLSASENWYLGIESI